MPKTRIAPVKESKSRHKAVRETECRHVGFSALSGPCLILATLVNLALAQPVLDLLGRSPEFFIARHANELDPILLVLLLCILLPLLISLLLMLASQIHRKVSSGLFQTLMALLIAVLVLELIKNVTIVDGKVLVVIAVITGALIAWVVHRFSFAWDFLKICSIAIIIIPVNFLLFTDVKKIVFPEQENTEEVSIKIEKQLPIVLIVFDALPLQSLLNSKQQIDGNLFPHFAKLAEGSTWYRRATSVSFETLTAVPAILSGKLPDANRLPTALDYPQNLFSLLGFSYELFVHEPYTQLCPTSLCPDMLWWESVQQRFSLLIADVSVVFLHLLLPEDMSTDLPSITQDWKHFEKSSPRHKSKGNTRSSKANSVLINRADLARLQQDDFTSVFAANISKIEPRATGSLYFQHILLPHIPWRYLPSGKQYLNSHNLGIEKTGKWVENETIVHQEFHRHLLQLGYVDSLLGKLLHQLEVSSVFDDAMVIITADHGASFRQGEFKRRSGVSNRLDIALVPLFVKYPQQKVGEVVDDLVQSIDILPTIADILEIDLPRSVAGQSLLSKSAKPRDQVVVYHLPKKFKFKIEDIANASKQAELLAIKNHLAKGWYHFGPYHQLIGTIEPVVLASDKQLTAIIANRSEYNNVDPNGTFIPARIMGSLQGLEPGVPATLAIGLNGLIAATSKIYRDVDGMVRFSTMLPPDFFRSGKNTVRLFLIDESLPETPKLIPVSTGAMTDYRLQERNSDGKLLLVDDNGVSIEVMPGHRKNRVRGYVDNANRGNQVTSFSGWAVDSRPTGKEVEVVIFSGGKLLASTQPNLARVDVAKAFNKAELKYSGFRFHIPSIILPKPGAERVRIFMLTSDGIATELRYAKNYPWK